MGKFLEVDKGRQILFRETSEYFTDAAKADGVYLRKPRRFCLPVDHAEENLFGEIRASALSTSPACRSIGTTGGTDDRVIIFAAHRCNASTFSIHLRKDQTHYAHCCSRSFPPYSQ